MGLGGVTLYMYTAGPRGWILWVSARQPEHHAGEPERISRYPLLCSVGAPAGRNDCFSIFGAGAAHEGSGDLRDGRPLGGCHSSSLGLWVVCRLWLWPLSLIVSNGYTSRDSPLKCFNLPEDPVGSLPRFTDESWVSGSK